MERQWNSGMEQPDRPHLFGIRHLSPSGAWHLRKFLDETDPELVLIEGPSDFTELLEDLTKKEVKPPVAVMAYTSDLPIRTILYPLAVYSPEYQAALWAREKGKKARFFDLPSSVFLALEDQEKLSEENPGEKDKEDRESGDIGTTRDIYARLDQAAGTGGNEDFWEHVLEHSETPKGYQMEQLSLERSFAAFLRTQRERQTEKTGFVNAACFGRSRKRWRREFQPAGLRLSQGPFTWPVF